MTISLLVGVSALAFSFLHNDLVHLPDHTGGASLRKREEILLLPIMDGRSLPIPFSSAAVLIDIEIHNKEAHALALCSELTRSTQSSQLKPFQRLLPCGSDKKAQLVFDTKEEAPHVWSTAELLDTSSVHFLRTDQLRDLTLVRITAENHNSLHSAAFTYTITVSVVGPKNPLYWFHWLNQEAQTSKLPFEKQMWDLLAVTKQQTLHLLTYSGHLKKHIPNFSKLKKTIRTVLNPQSCRSADLLPGMASWRKSCLRFTVNESVDALLTHVFPPADFCRSFFSGGLIVGVLAGLNVLGYFFMKTDNVATTMIQFYSFKRLFLSLFAHFDWMHLFFNLRMLVITGSRLITLLDCDHALFLWFYLLSGLGGGVVSLLWRRARGSCSYSAGASSALYGISMVLAVLVQVEGTEGLGAGSALNRLLYGRRGAGTWTGEGEGGSETLQLLVSVIGMDVARAVLWGGAGIDTAAHVGGALTGLLLVTWYLA